MDPAGIAEAMAKEGSTGIGTMAIDGMADLTGTEDLAVIEVTTGMTGITNRDVILLRTVTISRATGRPVTMKR